MAEESPKVAEESPVLGKPYGIVTIKRSDAPEGTEGKNWYSYVISQGPNVIQGYRQGSLRAVTEAVEEVVGQLNERRMGKRGRVNLVPTPKKKPQS